LAQVQLGHRRASSKIGLRNKDYTAMPAKLWHVEPGTFTIERRVADEQAKRRSR